MRYPTSEMSARWRGEIDQLDQRLRAATDGLDAAALTWSPPEGGWSIAQVLEHLAIAEGLYLDSLRPAVRDPDAPRAANATWKSTWIGRLLVKGTQTKMKVPAPPVFRPGPDPRPDVPGKLRSLRAELRTLVEAADGLDWNRIRMASPVASLLRMNLGDTFAITLGHARRHADQIDRIRAHPAFPRGSQKTTAGDVG